MKIFVLPSWYKNDSFPENCIFIYEQVAGLSKLGHQVIVISPQLSLKPIFKGAINHKKDEVSDILYKDYFGVRPSIFPKQNIRGFKKNAFALFKEAIGIYGKPDVIYAHFSIPAGFIATQLGKKYNIPVVVVEHHSSLMKEKWPRYKYNVLKNTIKDVQYFICVSEGLKQSIERKLGKYDNMVVVSNMINPCFQYKNVINNHFIFFSMGSLIPRKGFDFLIQSFAKVFREKDVELRIAGRGKMKETLEELIRSLGMDNQIHLIGQLSREDTLKQYEECNCFVLASQAETFGLVYREALAVGRPIISTRHGGFTEADWHNEYGSLVNYGNYNEMEKALLNIYNNYKEYNLRNISDLCLSTCSEKVVMKTIEDILTKSKHIDVI